MRRKFLTILLALALCVCMAAPVFAATGCKQYSYQQNIYEQLRQYLTCRIFGYGCPSPSAPCKAQTPVPAEPSAPETASPSESDSAAGTQDLCTQGSCTTAPDPQESHAAPAQNPEAAGQNSQSPDQTSGEPSASTVSSMEQQVVTLVNRQRAAYGLKALTLDESLSGYARIKSQDLHDNRYFDHQSPTYGSPFDMMRSFGISYSYAGENIAMGYFSAEDVVNAWMDSSGHRANILNANYDRIGVGYVADGGYWTQWFLG